MNIVQRSKEKTSLTSIISMNSNSNSRIGSKILSCGRNAENLSKESYSLAMVAMVVYVENDVRRDDEDYLRLKESEVLCIAVMEARRRERDSD